MKPIDRNKMCTNCDGRVPFEAIVCPYCSADLSKAVETEIQRADPFSRNQAIQDSLTSLYAPPYKGKSGEQIKPTFRERMPPPAHHGGTSAAPGTIPRSEEEEKTSKNVLFAILSLSLGSLLFILGMLQVFCSESGTLCLEWNTKYWFVYLVAALPLLYLGYRKADEKIK